MHSDVTAYSSDITANTYTVAAKNVTANNCDVKAATSPAGAAVANSSFLWAGRSSISVADETTIKKCRGKPDGGATVAAAETPGGDFLQHSLSRLIRWGKRTEKEAGKIEEEIESLER